MILKNIEIKARINDYEKVKRLVEDLCSTPIRTEDQIDTFFNTPKGRLKLRKSDSNAEIIYYNRPDSFEPTQSDIAISFTENPNTLRTVLAKSIGIRGIVKKNRTLYKYGQTRIHFDDVEGLGKFIEIEEPYRVNFRVLIENKLITFYLLIPSDKENELVRKIEATYGSSVAIKKVTIKHNFDFEKCNCIQGMSCNSITPIGISIGLEPNVPSPL